MNQPDPLQRPRGPAALAALGSPTRRAIIKILAENPGPVGALANRLPVSRPAISKHLKILQNAGFVAHRRVGTRNLYHLQPSGFEAARGWLDEFWEIALDRYRLVAENTDPDQADE